MNKFIFLIFTVGAAQGCAINRAPSERMLDVRAGYGHQTSDLGVEFKPAEKKIVPERTSAVTADIWVYPNEMQSKDYFLGGWIRTVIKEPHWWSEATVSEAFKPVTVSKKLEEKPKSQLKKEK